MRMWMVNPKMMCRKHLLGEHVELHMLLGCLTKNKNIDGFVTGGLVEVHNLKTRHDELIVEMENRGYNHKTPINTNNLQTLGKVDVEGNIKELNRRCPECTKNYEEMVSKSKI